MLLSPYQEGDGFIRGYGEPGGIGKGGVPLLFSVRSAVSVLKSVPRPQPVWQATPACPPRCRRPRATASSFRSSSASTPAARRTTRYWDRDGPRQSRRL